MKLAFDRGGEGSQLLVLLHGLGATRHVWQPMLESATAKWNGSWIAPDLRGHGGSPTAANYALGNHAADVAEMVFASGAWAKIVILGHSMGGVIALTLASGWFGFTPARVFGLGIKVAWNEDELAGLRKLAASPVRTFASEQEAVARYLRVSGMGGLVSPESAEAKAGVVKDEDGWRLACDPATANVAPLPMQQLLSAAQCPVQFARGETDALVTLEQLRAFDANAVEIADAGHNAMVEKPDAAWAWLSSRLHDR